MTTRQKSKSAVADPWKQRVDRGDWEAITAEVNTFGGALLPQLLTDAETAHRYAMYQRDDLLRTTINMGRHRFGEGEYRYSNAPYPKPIEALKQALSHGCCRSRATGGPNSGGRPPWQDTIDEWLAMCHQAS
ncbi:MAG: 2OG-Fe(II) oxygenase, partial [Jatrophihabitantaceae bacterium]